MLRPQGYPKVLPQSTGL